MFSRPPSAATRRGEREREREKRERERDKEREREIYRERERGREFFLQPAAREHDRGDPTPGAHIGAD
eukprot:4075861-Heterocapsa_arctica.AAC.1